MNILCYLNNYFLSYTKQLTFICIDGIHFFFVLLYIMLNKTIENVGIYDGLQLVIKK